MKSKIIYKLMLPLLLFLFIILSIFISTNYIISLQSRDALIVNLAGRERMLSQKMFKELLLYEKTENKVFKEALQNTTKVFETTLLALAYGGEVPLDLKWEKKDQLPPASSEDVLNQLNKVIKIWNLFKENSEGYLETKDKNQFATITEVNLSLLIEMDKAVVLFQKDAEKKIIYMKSIQTFFLIFGIAIFLFSTLFNSRKLLKPITHISHFVSDLSEAKGDLTYKIPIETEDEIGALGNSFNNFANSLRKNLIKIFFSFRTNVVGISHIGRKMRDFSASIAFIENQLVQNKSDIENIALVTNEQSIALENVADISQNLSSIVENLHSISTSLNIKAVESKQDVLDVSNIIKEIKKSVELFSQKNHELSEKALIINKVTETINGISKKTNLLALNASIEAARAGEYGKSFSVVASEVGHLATESKRTIEEISKHLSIIIQEIQINSRESNILAEKINWVDSKNQETINKLNGIFNNINGINSNTELISTKTRNLGAGTEELAASARMIHEKAEAIQEKNNQVCILENKMTGEIQRLSENLESIINGTIESISHLSNITLFDSSEFNQELNNACNAHIDWVKKLEESISGGSRDIELNHHRCNFGVFYHSTPAPQGHEKVWVEINEIHKQVHSSAQSVFKNIDIGDISSARKQVEEVKQASVKFVGLLNKVKILN